MKHKITRRDFINGVAIGAGAGFLNPISFSAHSANVRTDAPYPPLRSGMRGNHSGSYDAMHALAWNDEKPAGHKSLNEHYDLIVVGAGVSGLAAAHFFQKTKRKKAKILLLDNHDDFGGHAKRNEFHYKGKTLLGIGGSNNIDTPESWGMVSRGLLDDLGVDLQAMQTNNTNPDVMNPLAESFMSLSVEGERTNVRGNWALLLLGVGDYEAAIDALPFEQAECDRLKDLVGGKRDFLDDLSLAEKLNYIETTSYLEFLKKRIGLSSDIISVLDPFPILMAGAAAPRLSVLEAVSLGCPGLRGMGWLGDKATSLMTKLLSSFTSVYFPDGNASIARLLVRRLIPEVAPNTTGFQDIAASRFNYEALDKPGNSARLRLNSTVVHVEETEQGTVSVDYVQGAETVSVTADHCILACFNAAIPYICPQLPEAQKEALRYGVKVPLVMSNVMLENGRAFEKLGTMQIQCPNDPYVLVTVPPPTTTGGYKPVENPDSPMVVYMLGAPTLEPEAGEAARDLLLRARHEVYATDFDTYEQQIREQLQALLGPHGFNHETDIKAITVNRWAHGYSYAYLALDDPKWAVGEAPHEIGRRQFGRISIANSDSEARAFLDAAIDAGWRAVAEQTH